MTHAPSLPHIFGRALMVSGVATICFTAPAYAGFEWRGPIEPPVRKEAPAAASIDMGGMDIMSPEPSSVAAPAEPVETAPLRVVATPVPVQAAPSMGVDTLPLDGDVVAGFGRDLPLVIALQQVAPAGHQFAFAAGVNPGTSVSWEGGKPWRTVLQEMLASKGLAYQLQGNVIAVGLGAGAPAPQAPATTGMAPLSIMPQDDFIAAPPRQTAAPQEDFLTPDEKPVAVPAAAPAADDLPSSEPIIIRRQRAASAKEGRMAGAQPAPMKVASSAQVVSEYPAQTAGTTAAKPAAAVGLSAAAPVTEAPAHLSEPPAMTAADVSAPMSLVEKPVSPQAAGASWSAASGATLRDTLKSWSDAAKVEMYWSIDYDYRLSTPVIFSGSYDEAVGKLLDQFATARPQPYGQLHQSRDGARVLVVKSYDVTL